MITAQQEVVHAIQVLALSIETEHEGFKRAVERARNLFRIKQQRETAALLTALAFVPTCKSEVYDPDVYGFQEQETYFDDEDEE